MKTKLLKSILCIFIILSMLLTLFSCNATDTVNKASQSDTEITDVEDSDIKETYNGDYILDYEIKEIDGEFRLVFNDISKYLKPKYVNDEYGLPITWITFKNVKEMQNTILTGQLTHSQKSIIANHFIKDSKGIIIPDLYNVYSPIFPDEKVFLYDDTVTLGWDGYYWDIGFSNLEGGVISCICLSKYSYKDNFEYANSSEYSIEKFTSLGKEVDEVGGEKEVFERNNQKIIQYTLSNEHKRMHIVELHDYWTTCYDADIFYELNGAYFEIFTFCEGIESPFDPKWLFEFDVEKYVPDQNT